MNLIAKLRMWKAAVVLGYVMYACSPVFALVIQPVDRNDVLSTHVDRSVAMSDFMIWDKVVGAVGGDNADVWSRISWVCMSANDAKEGACATKSKWAPGGGEASNLELKFVEKSTHAEIVLTLKGFNFYVGIKPSGDIEVWNYGRRELNAAGSGVGVSGNAVQVYIPKDQLQKIPSGGQWVGTLKLNMMQWSPFKKIATYTANITIDVTDRNNVQVYLPEFPTATPRVDLNLRLSGAGAKTTLAGRSNLDMCLYDGYNSASTWFDVTASDDRTVSGRDADDFSVTRDGADGSDATKRIDYRVSLNYNGTSMALPNGKAIRLDGVNNARGRMVMLQGIPIPVICTPTPLTLTTPSFGALAKQAGQYRGNLRITFSPSAANL